MQLVYLKHVWWWCHGCVVLCVQHVDEYQLIFSKRPIHGTFDGVSLHRERTETDPGDCRTGFHVDQRGHTE